MLLNFLLPHTGLPIVVVRKSNGKLRICTDFRALNRVTRFNAEPMPSSNEIFAKLKGCKYLSKLDFAMGYYQIPLTESSKELTSFYSPLGLVHYTVMPFGYINAGSEYNQMMRKLLYSLESVDSFVDDVLTYSVEFDEHLVVLESVFDRILKAGLTVKPSKCFLGFNSIDFVGHRVGNDEISTLDDKIEKVKNAPLPETKTQLRSFLGLAGYYRQFCPHYATVAAPLNDLIKKKMPVTIDWNSHAIEAFDRLKQMLVTKPY